jgi:very-short-patch-repair endonuclease
MSVAGGTLTVMTREPSAAFWQHLNNQANVFTRRQALDGGFYRSAIDNRLRRGTWRTIYPGVYISSRAEFRLASKLWAAVLYAGRGAVLSHQTAAWLHRFGTWPGQIHVTVPAERRVRAPQGMRIHLSARAFDAAARHDHPPRTTAAETILDLVNESDSFDDVYSWVCKALTEEVIDEEALLAAARERGKLRWRAELTQILAAVNAGDESALENAYTRHVERRHRLPASERQVRFAGPGGKAGRRDRLYRDFKVIVELDGKLNHRGDNVRKDKARDRAAAAEGQQTVRLEWPDVRGQACTSAAEIAAILRERGWTGKPRPCSLTCRVADQPWATGSGPTG